MTLDTDTISYQRDCVLNVEDSARVRFFTAYRPDGTGGDVVGFVRTGHSAAEVANCTPFGIPPENMLQAFLSHGAVRAATFDDWCEGPARLSGIDTCSRSTKDDAWWLEEQPVTTKSTCYLDAGLEHYRDRAANSRDEWLNWVATSLRFLQSEGRCRWDYLCVCDNL